MNEWNILPKNMPSWELVGKWAILKFIKCDPDTLLPLDPEEPRFVRAEIHFAWSGNNVVFDQEDTKYELLSNPEYYCDLFSPEMNENKYYIKWKNQFVSPSTYEIFIEHSWMLENHFLERLKDYDWSEYKDEEDVPCYCSACGEKMAIFRPGDWRCVNPNCEECN